MRNVKIRNITVTVIPHCRPVSLKSGINEFHASVIERELYRSYSHLTARQKVSVVDLIIKNLTLPKSKT